MTDPATCDHPNPIEVSQLGAQSRTLMCGDCGDTYEAAPTDEQIRAYLDRNPAAFRQLIKRSARTDPAWWDQIRRRDARIHGRDVLLRDWPHL